jgi:hypothetical protein
MFGTASTPPLHERRDYELIADLLAVAGSPDAAKQRMDELVAISKKIAHEREALAKERSELQREREKHRKEVVDERQSHDARLKREAEAFAAEVARHRQEHDTRSAELARLLSQAENDSVAAKIAKDNFESRLAKLQEIARQ